MLAIGYAATPGCYGKAVPRFSPGHGVLWHPVGRMALTNYLLHSAVWRARCFFSRVRAWGGLRIGH